MEPFTVIAITTQDTKIDTQTLSEELGGVALVSTRPLPQGNISKSKEDEIVTALEAADALLIRIGTLGENVIRRLPRLKIIAIHGAGVERVDVNTATEMGIWVTNVPTGNTQAAVEFTIGLMISLLRRIPQANANLIREKDWYKSHYIGNEISGKVVGLVGFGNIAKRVAQVCQAMNAKVIATRNQLGSSEYIPILPFNELVKQSDIISLHVPLTPGTKGLINTATIKMMKPGALIVNVSRGPIIDQTALEQALLSGHLGGAALDVLETEPPDFSTPLFSLPNVIITSHMAGSSCEALERIARVAAKDILLALAGKAPINAVNSINRAT